MLGGNSAELYRIDTAALAPIVEAIGLTPDEVHGDATIEPIPA